MNADGDPGFWAQITSGLLAALLAVIGLLTAVSAWVWHRTYLLIDNKAEAGAMKALITQVELLIKNQRDDNERHREDNKLIFEAIKEVTKSSNEFAQEAIKELGARPTRDELNKMWRHRRIGDDE